MPSYTHFVVTERPVTDGLLTPDAPETRSGETESLVLDPLEDGQAAVRFDRFLNEGAARAASGGRERYRMRCEVRGSWTRAPQYAVYAIWQLSDPAQAAGFE